MSMSDSARILRRESRLPRRAVALLWVMVIAIGLAFAFFASSLCITFLLAGFLAILLDPIPTNLERWHIPRQPSTALVLVSGVLLLGFLGYASYGKASELFGSLPQYAERIREAIKPLTQKIEKVQKTAGSLAPAASPRKVPEV